MSQSVHTQSQKPSKNTKNIHVFALRKELQKEVISDSTKEMGKKMFIKSLVRSSEGKYLLYV